MPAALWIQNIRGLSDDKVSARSIPTCEEIGKDAWQTFTYSDQQWLIAFSCKGRGICPSCTARRMSNTAAHLVDHLLPIVPYRQWVMSFPWRIRMLLAKDAALLSKVLDLTLAKVSAWQRRKARTIGIKQPQTGTVTFVQRFGSLLNLNNHFHSILADGVFEDVDGQAEFRPTPAPTRGDIERLLYKIAKATEKLIVKYEAKTTYSEEHQHNWKSSNCKVLNHGLSLATVPRALTVVQSSNPGDAPFYKGTRFTRSAMSMSMIGQVWNDCAAMVPEHPLPNRGYQSLAMAKRL